MKKLRSLFLILTVSLPLFGFATSLNKSFDTIVGFGDSLSDNGNLYKYMLHFLPISPPYYEGHFSNGKVWLEQLSSQVFSAEQTENLQDYAVGGAGAVLSYKENLPFTLTAELNDYLYWNTYDHKETTLYTIWIGGNNYLNGPTNIDGITTSVTDAIGTVVERLIANGGDKFLIANLPSLGATPQAKKYGTQELLQQLTDVHNEKLFNKYTQLQQSYPDVTFIFFDVNKVFNQAIEAPESFDITNTSEPCYLGSYSGWFVPQAMLEPNQQTLKLYLQEKLAKRPDIDLDEEHQQLLLNNPVLREALNVDYTHDMAKSFGALEEAPLQCNEYLFWDHVHPTEKVHAVLAQEAKKLIDEAGLVASN